MVYYYVEVYLYLVYGCKFFDAHPLKYDLTDVATQMNHSIALMCLQERNGKRDRYDTLVTKFLIVSRVMMEVL